MYDVVQAKKIPNSDKTKWINLGVAFEKEGRISSVKLDALPIPDEKGEIWLRLFEKKEKKEGMNSFGSQRSTSEMLDDEIPI